MGDRSRRLSGRSTQSSLYHPYPLSLNGSRLPTHRDPSRLWVDERPGTPGDPQTTRADPTLAEQALSGRYPQVRGTTRPPVDLDPK